MNNRKVAFACAAGFLGLGITGVSTQVQAKKPVQVTVTATDPSLQRRVSYADLNLAVKPDQRVLRHRISYTASDLCFDINGWDDGSCKAFAIASTRDQVRAAIDRAERQMAGLAVGPPTAIAMVIAVH
jgi:UrcA family protein